MPRVSVVMSVYNGAGFLHDAVGSILGQTCGDFEFIIVDDGSTDYSALVLDSYRDCRIKRLSNSRNLGIAASLNRGLAVASADYIARQDADDASLPHRLERQVSYLDQHSTVGLLGTGAYLVDSCGDTIDTWKPRPDNPTLQQILLTTNCFTHGSVMMRRAALQDAGGFYNDSLSLAQDYDLWLRVAESWDVANVPDLLYKYRHHDRMVSVISRAEQDRYAAQVRQPAVARRLGYGRAKLGYKRECLPARMRRARRSWWAQRYTWWSAGARGAGSRWYALEFLLIALLIDPTYTPTWDYLASVIVRKGRSALEWARLREAETAEHTSC